MPLSSSIDYSIDSSIDEYLKRRTKFSSLMRPTAAAVRHIPSTMSNVRKKQSGQISVQQQQDKPCKEVERNTYEHSEQFLDVFRLTEPQKNQGKGVGMVELARQDESSAVRENTSERTSPERPTQRDNSEPALISKSTPIVRFSSFRRFVRSPGRPLSPSASNSILTTLEKREDANRQQACTSVNYNADPPASVRIFTSGDAQLGREIATCIRETEIQAKLAPSTGIYSYLSSSSSTLDQEVRSEALEFNTPASMIANIRVPCRPEDEPPSADEQGKVQHEESSDKIKSMVVHAAKVQAFRSDEVKAVSSDKVKVVCDNECTVGSDDEFKIVGDDEFKVAGDDEFKAVGDDEVKVVSDDECKIVSDDEFKVVSYNQVKGVSAGLPTCSSDRSNATKGSEDNPESSIPSFTTSADDLNITSSDLKFSFSPASSRLSISATEDQANPGRRDQPSDDATKADGKKSTRESTEAPWEVPKSTPRKEAHLVYKASMCSDEHTMKGRKVDPLKAYNNKPRNEKIVNKKDPLSLALSSAVSVRKRKQSSQGAQSKTGTIDSQLENVDLEVKTPNMTNRKSFFGESYDSGTNSCTSSLSSKPSGEDGSDGKLSEKGATDASTVDNGQNLKSHSVSTGEISEDDTYGAFNGTFESQEGSQDNEATINDVLGLYQDIVELFWKSPSQVKNSDDRFQVTKSKQTTSISFVSDESITPPVDSSNVPPALSERLLLFCGNKNLQAIQADSRDWGSQELFEADFMQARIQKANREGRDAFVDNDESTVEDVREPCPEDSVHEDAIPKDNLPNDAMFDEAESENESEETEESLNVVTAKDSKVEEKSELVAALGVEECPYRNLQFVTLDSSNHQLTAYDYIFCQQPKHAPMLTQEPGESLLQKTKGLPPSRIQRYPTDLDLVEYEKTSLGHSPDEAAIIHLQLQAESHDHESFEVELDTTEVAIAIQSIRDRGGHRAPYMESGPFSSFASIFTPKNYAVQRSEFEEHVDNVTDALDEINLHIKDPSSVDVKQVAWTGESYVQPCQEFGRSTNYFVALPVQDIPSPMLPIKKFSLAREVQILKDITVEDVCGRVWHGNDDKDIFDSKESLVSTGDESKQSLLKLLLNSDSNAASGVQSSQKDRHIDLESACDSKEELSVAVPKKNSLETLEPSAKEATDIAFLRHDFDGNVEQKSITEEKQLLLNVGHEEVSGYTNIISGQASKAIVAEEVLLIPMEAGEGEEEASTFELRVTFTRSVDDEAMAASRDSAAGASSPKDREGSMLSPAMFKDFLNEPAKMLDLKWTEVSMAHIQKLLRTSDNTDSMEQYLGETPRETTDNSAWRDIPIPRLDRLLYDYPSMQSYIDSTAGTSDTNSWLNVPIPELHATPWNGVRSVPAIEHFKLMMAEEDVISLLTAGSGFEDSGDIQLDSYTPKSPIYLDPNMMSRVMDMMSGMATMGSGLLASSNPKIGKTVGQTSSECQIEESNEKTMA